MTSCFRLWNEIAASTPTPGHRRPISPPNRDPAKDAGNQRKHGVSSGEARIAFLDPGRVIVRDMRHSQAEQRYSCFGRVSEGVLTVRFPYRSNIIRIIGAGFWRRGSRLHKAHYEVQRCAARRSRQDQESRLTNDNYSRSFIRHQQM